MPELFLSSKLEMSLAPLEQASGAMMWGDYITNRVAIILALVLLLVEVQDIIRLFPSLLRCVPLWKGNLELEHSVSMARTRNTVALVLALLVSIVADRFALLNPSWRALVPPAWQIAVTIGLVSAMAIVRRLFYLISPFRSKTAEYACTVRHTFYNYFILFAVLAVLTGVLLGAFKVPDGTVRGMLLAETALVYLLSLLRTGQILRSRYGVFATILYLCALEILPVAALILTCTK